MERFLYRFKRGFDTLCKHLVFIQICVLEHSTLSNKIKSLKVLLLRQKILIEIYFLNTYGQNKFIFLKVCQELIG